MLPSTRLLRRAIRHKALWSGLLGPSRLWRIVGLWVFGRATLKKLFGKQPETLEVATLGSGRYLSVETSKPLSRRRRRKLDRTVGVATTKAALAAAARAELAARAR